MVQASTNPGARVDVCLVLMPYAFIEHPSIALSILKSGLTQGGITSSVVYANLMFAEEIIPHVYELVAGSRQCALMGEWTFSPTAFPDYKGNNDAYFRHIQPWLAEIEPSLWSLGVRERMSDTLWKIRCRTSEFVERVCQSVLRMAPRIVACSSMFQQHCASLGLLRRVKELMPETVTVIGGANCEDPMGGVTLQECPWVDYVVGGDADLTFPMLCKIALELGTDTSTGDLPSGVWSSRNPVQRSQESNDEVLETGCSRGVLTGMDDSPVPDYSDYFSALASSSIIDMIKPGLLIETSRGCWWGQIHQCKFCGLNSRGMRFRQKSTQRVQHELQYLSAKHGIKSFLCTDNVMSLSYFSTLFPDLASTGEYKLCYQTRPNLTRSNLQTMAAAGIRWVFAGIESLDDSILTMMGKGSTAIDGIQLLKWAKEFGIDLAWNFLYGLPREPDSAYLDVAKLIPSISHLQPPQELVPIHYCRFSPYVTHPQGVGLKLSSDRSYSFVYPWRDESIKRFAYFFDDYSMPRQRIDLFNTDELARPGLRALRNAYLDWLKERRTSARGQCASLVFKDDGFCLEIQDTRKCRTQDVHHLTGLSRRIYLMCDRARTLSRVVSELSSQCDVTPHKAEVEKIVLLLCEHRLMLNSGGRFLSLATPSSAPSPPDRVDFPGGRLLKRTDSELGRSDRYVEWKGGVR